MSRGFKTSSSSTRSGGGQWSLSSTIKWKIQQLKSRTQCHICKKTGHWKRECPLRGKDRGRGKASGQNNQDAKSENEVHCTEHLGSFDEYGGTTEEKNEVHVAESRDLEEKDRGPQPEVKSYLDKQNQGFDQDDGDHRAARPFSQVVQNQKSTLPGHAQPRVRAGTMSSSRRTRSCLMSKKY